MKFTQHAPDTVAELLIYVADQESFASLKNLRNWSKQEIKLVLTELADHLKEASAKEPIVRKSQLMASEFADRTKKVINKLTPQEEEILLKSFKISS